MSTVTPPPSGVTTARSVWQAVKTPLALLALLALLWFSFRWGWRAFSEPVPTPPPPACVPASMPELSSDKVAVTVLNGSTERGRAGVVAGNLKSVGFQVERTGNTEERITQTTIRGGAADDPQVRLVASFFTDAKVEADGRQTGTVDVLVGARNPEQVGDDWAGMKKDAAPKIALPSGSVCLPAPDPTATPSPTAQPR